MIKTVRVAIWIFLLAFGADLWAIHSGSSESEAISEFGTPQMEKLAGQSKTLYFQGGVRVYLQEGRVVSWDGIAPSNTSAARPQQKILPADKVSVSSSAERSRAVTPVAQVKSKSALPDIGSKRFKDGLKTALYIGLCVTFLVYYLGIVGIAFKDSPSWGIACLFIPLVVKIYILTHRDTTMRFALGCIAVAGVQFLILINLK